MLGSASIDVDSQFNVGALIAELETTEASGPIVPSSTQQLDGQIRIVMDTFYGFEFFKSGGIAEVLLLHGDTGFMSTLTPQVEAETAGWGLLDIYLDGELIYEDLEGHFMVTERVRRGSEDGFRILRDADGVIYSPDLEDKTGFDYSTKRELHLWASGTAGEDVLLHLNFLIRDEVVGFGGEAPPPGDATPSDDPPVSDPPDEDPQPPVNDPPNEDPPTEDNPNAGPKGSNGIGNGVDPQPPGNPPINDDEGSSPETTRRTRSSGLHIAARDCGRASGA